MGSDRGNLIDELIDEDVEWLIENIRPLLNFLMTNRYKHSVEKRGLVVYPENEDLLDSENR